MSYTPQTLFGGKSDPYVVLTIGTRRISFVDEYIERNVNPEWDYHAEFPLERLQGSSLVLEVRHLVMKHNPEYSSGV